MGADRPHTGVFTARQSCGQLGYLSCLGANWALRVLAGCSQDMARPQTVSAQAEFDVLKAQSRLQFLRGNVDVFTGRFVCTYTRSKASAMLRVCPQQCLNHDTCRYHDKPWDGGCDVFISLGMSMETVKIGLVSVKTGLTTACMKIPKACLY